MSGATFAIYLEGDNTETVLLWNDAPAGSTTITVQFGFPGQPIPTGRQLVIRQDSTEPDIGAIQEYFVGTSWTSLGFGLWDVTMDRPLALDWFAGAVVHSRFYYAQCTMLGDDSILRKKKGDLFDVAMLIRTHTVFTTP